MSSYYTSFTSLTHFLSVDCDEVSLENQYQLIMSHEIFWQEIIDIANENLLVPALYFSLLCKNFLINLPVEVNDYLEQIYALNTERNSYLRSQIVELTVAMNAISLTPLLLKGSHYIACNTFNDAGVRMMYDIDIMVPKDHVDAVAIEIRKLGYRSDPAKEIKLKNHHHLAPFFRPGDYGAVELHRELLAEKASPILGSLEVWQDVVPVALDGYSACILSSTHQVLHSILHAQVVDQYHDRHIIKLRALFDLVSFVKKNRKQIDWLFISDRMQEFGHLQILLSQLYQAHKLLGFEIPAEIKPGWYARYHYYRCISSVRWDVVAAFEEKIWRYSRSEICRYYHCEDKWVSVMLFRVKRMMNYIKRIV